MMWSNDDVLEATPTIMARDANDDVLTATYAAIDDDTWFGLRTVTDGLYDTSVLMYRAVCQPLWRPQNYD